MRVENDGDAWLKYPNTRHLFNKMFIAQKQGLAHGPAGVPVPVSGWYCVRPIYNLNGLGAESFRMFLTPDTLPDAIPPGHFWCEWVDGRHLSIDYSSSLNWGSSLCVEGHRHAGRPLHMFHMWEVCDPPSHLQYPPSFVLDDTWLQNVFHLNVEFIGNTVIEVHLRPNPDFKGTACKRLHVVWSALDSIDPIPHNIIQSSAVVGGHKRVGFIAE